MKHNKYPKLFEKGYIGNLKVKNRIIRNSMGTYLADGNMYVGDRTIKVVVQVLFLWTTVQLKKCIIWDFVQQMILTFLD